MQYRHLGRSGLKVSVLGLGTMMFGDKTSEAESIRITHKAIDAGVNLIDVADTYADGESERILGKALRHRRSEAVLATKGGHLRTGRGLSRRDLFRSVADSLQRLQTDYIDLYQVHRFDPETPLEETLSALTDLVQAGQLRSTGCSNFAAWDGIPAGTRGSQRPDWQQKFLTPANQAAAVRVREIGQRLGRPAGQVALRWCLAHPAVSSAAANLHLPVRPPAVNRPAA